MKIYLDIILLENICMNYIILYATSVITKTKPKVIKILIGSTIGAIYAVIVVLNILDIYQNIIFKILVSAVIVYISIESKTLKILLRNLLIFYVTSFTFGGVAFAMLYFIKPENIIMKNGLYIGTYPIKIALMGGIVGYTILIAAFANIKKKFSRKDLYCKIIIEADENIATINALVDTGNFLKDPITGTPVVVIEKDALNQVIPKEILENTEKIMTGKMELQGELEEYKSKLRVIPFTSLGKQNGMLLGIKVEKITIINDEEEKEIKNVIIGIYEKNLTKENKYKALINLELLERNEENEYIGNFKV